MEAGIAGAKDTMNTSQTSVLDAPEDNQTLKHFGTRSLVVHCTETAPAGWNHYLQKWGYDGFHLRSEWGTVFRNALRHQPFFLRAEEYGRTVGVLPLMFIDGPLFGRFLVSQPYLNTGGTLADHTEAESALISAAIRLAEELQVRHLELRHERRVEHPGFNAVSTEKVHMRLELPGTSEELWNGLKSKLRSQVRKPLNDSSLSVRFGRFSELDDFYSIFCRNMRDLGTPPFSKSLFRTMLQEFPDSEISTVTSNGRPVASGFLLHAPEVTLIPSASALREFNHTNCNLLMYWHCLSRSVERGQKAFDFGRSTPGSGTYRFKEQWGAEASPGIWQYRMFRGEAADLRPSGGKYGRAIQIWQKLPVWLTKLIGPTIVRGIP